jgi:hypothetical protein
MLLFSGFTGDGVLPPGDYPLTLDDLENSMLVLGPGEPRSHPCGTPRGVPGWSRIFA